MSIILQFITLSKPLSRSQKQKNKKKKLEQEKEDKKFNSKEYKLEKADQKTREYDKSGVIKLPALTNDNGKLST